MTDAKFTTPLSPHHCDLLSSPVYESGAAVWCQVSCFREQFKRTCSDFFFFFFFFFPLVQNSIGASVSTQEINNFLVLI